MKRASVVCTLEDVLEEKGRTIEWLSEQTRVSPTTYQNYISNFNQRFERYVLEEICEKLKCTPGDFLQVEYVEYPDLY